MVLWGPVWRKRNSAHANLKLFLLSFTTLYENITDKIRETANTEKNTVINESNKKASEREIYCSERSRENKNFAWAERDTLRWAGAKYVSLRCPG